MISGGGMYVLARVVNGRACGVVGMLVGAPVGIWVKPWMCEVSWRMMHRTIVLTRGSIEWAGRLAHLVSAHLSVSISLRPRIEGHGALLAMPVQRRIVASRTRLHPAVLSQVALQVRIALLMPTSSLRLPKQLMSARPVVVRALRRPMQNWMHMPSPRHCARHCRFCVVHSLVHSMSPWQALNCVVQGTDGHVPPMPSLDWRQAKLISHAQSPWMPRDRLP